MAAALADGAGPALASDPATPTGGPLANGLASEPPAPPQATALAHTGGELGSGLYRVAPWVLVRTPTLPVSALSWAREPQNAIAEPEVLRALAVGSPTLLDKALRPDPDPKDAQRTGAGLARYLIRMSTRPTPYGAFAAVSLAGWATETDLCLGAQRRTRTRPDMGWLRGLLHRLEARPDVRARLRWRSEPLAVQSGDRLIGPTGGSVRATQPALLALAVADSWIGYDELIEQVRSGSGGSAEQVAGLIDQLRTSGLLRSDLEPAVTGPDATDGSDARAVTVRADPSLGEAMTSLSEAIGAADQGENPAAAFATVRQQARALFDGGDDAFQTDLARDLAGRRLAGAVGEECARAVEVLLRLGPGPSGAGDLAGYTARFAARWGQGAEVPLVQMFDPQRGLGPLPHTHGAASVLDPAVTARRADRLSALALEALHDDRRVVRLDAELVSALSGWPAGGAARPLTPEGATDAPLSVDVSAFLLAAGPAAVDAGDFTLVIGPNLGAPVGGRWLGRFADLFGAEGAAYYTWLNNAEQQADPAAVPAEVVYLPSNPRSTNVIVRPTLAEHEIVVSGRGSAKHQLDLTDLLVGFDGVRLYLRSASLGIRLRPTARHMLNHHGAPPVCQFLDAVGQGVAAELTGFDWGAAESLPVLPRVQVGRTVLAPARWLISVPGWTQADGVSRQALDAALDRARGTWGLPERVYASVADNRLLLDLSEPDDREQLRREFKGSGGALRLQEALPDVGDAWVPGPDGQYLTELVISLVRRPPGARGAATGERGSALARPGGADDTERDEGVDPRPPLAAEPDSAGIELTSAQRTPTTFADRPPLGALDRVRLPGSEWLFAKFYAGYDQLTRLLVSDLADLIDMAENSGLARQWFFLRYSDPEPHLRVRWQGDPELLLRHLLPQVGDFAQQLIESGRIGRLAIDTYELELDRYGGPRGLALCERVFHADSRAVRRLLAATGPDPTDLAVASSVALLAGLGLDAERRIAFYDSQLALIGDPQVGRAAGDDYRARKTRLRDLVGAGPAGEVGAALDALRAELDPVGRALQVADEAGELDRPFDELLPSLVHMHHNRMIGPGQPSEPHLLQLLLRTERGLAVSGGGAA